MAKQLNVEMNIDANVEQAKRQIQQLKTQLDGLASGKSLNLKQTPLNQSLSESLTIVNKLKAALNDATNTNTGRLDLTAFTKNMKNAGLEVSQIRNSLQQLGPEGTSAFISLSKAVQQADTPLVSLNKKMGSLFTTLKNTAKWQISSSILHGFISTISGAYRYAQDLNESLNNIRIRTGQSTEEMARFAEQANRAAKELSTTTTAYTNAALIYYQQGLNDEQVKARTDVTVKMANVTRDSAETVSQQLTAVWNNFDKGGEKLEYIADVMNALGAATASSTSEIATGLQKFAAAADAAGLSYEYAASALATITATTRQSADTVGTGLRTVLARLESLSLGETLEDGVGLTKYTKALEAIGVQVLDNNGQLKEADVILDAMAEKWQGLTNAQKMATAETVGGIRQYTTIMALMENWDFMQKNLDVAYNSEGTLQEQADIYAESWEAAGQRVKAAAQEIYNDLIDDKFFITILNGVEKILTFVDDLIKSLGGLPGLLSTISTIVLTLFGDKVTNGLTNMAQTMSLLMNRKEVTDWKESFNIAGINAAMSDGTNRGEVQAAQMENMGKLNQAINENIGKFSELDQKQIQAARDSIQLGYEQLEVYGKQLDALEAQSQEIEEQILAKTSAKDQGEMQEAFLNLRQRINLEQQDEDTRTAKISGFDLSVDTKAGEVRAFLKDIVQEFGVAEESADKFFNKIKNVDSDSDKIAEVVQGIKGISPASKDAAQAIALMYKELSGKKTGDKIGTELFEQFQKNLKGLEATSKTFAEKMTKEDLAWITELAEKSGADANKLLTVYQKIIAGNRQMGDSLELLDNEGQKVLQGVTDGAPFQNWATNMVGAARGISTLSMGINSFLGSMNTLKQGIEEGNLTFSKMLSVVGSLAMSFTMVLPQITPWLNKLKTGFISLTASAVEYSAKTMGIKLTHDALSLSTNNLSTSQKNYLTTMLMMIVNSKKLNAEQKQTAITNLLVKAGVEETTAAHYAELLAIKLKEIALKKYMAIAIAAVAVIAAIVAITASLVTTQKEAAEAIDKATEAYDKEKDKLDQLKNSLKEIQDQIEELQQKGTLTLTEQAELRRLKQQAELLEKQLEIQQQITREKQKEQAQTIADNFKTSAALSGKAYKNVGQAYLDQNLDRGKIEQDFKDAMQSYQETQDEDAWKKAQTLYENYKAALIEIDKLSEEEVKRNLDTINANEENFAAYIDALSSNVIDYDQEKLAGMVDSIASGRKLLAGSLDKYYADIFETMSASKDFNINDILSRYIDEGAVTLKPKEQRLLLEMGVPIQDFLDSVTKQVETFKSKFKDTSIIEKFFDSIPEEDIALAIQLNVTGDEQLDELLEKFGKLKETTLTSDESTLIANYADNQKTLKSLKEGSTNISAEEWSKLGPAAQEYFVMMKDGTYELIGSAEEFYNVVRRQTIDAFKKDISSKQDQINSLREERNAGTFSADTFSNQLVESGGATQSQIDTWKTMWESGNEFAKNTAWSEWNAALEKAHINTESLQEQYDYWVNTELPQLQSELAVSCQNLQELDNLLYDGTLTLEDNKDNITAYCEGLIALGNNYASCNDEIRQMQLALSTNNEEYIKNTSAALKNAIAIEELAEAYELSAEDIEEQAEEYSKVNKKLAENQKAAQKLSVLNQKMNQGVESLSKNWSKWKSIIDSTDHTSMDYVDTMQELQEAVHNLLGVSDETAISTEFLEDNLELIERAAAGDEKAINALGVALAEATVEAWNFVEGMQFLDENGNLFDASLDQFENYKSEILEGITALQQEIINGTVTAGDNITSLMDGTGASWIESLNQMAIATGMSVQQMNDLLSQLGVQAKVEVHTMKQEMEVPTQEEVYLPSGSDTFTYTEIGEDGESEPKTIVRPRIRKAVIPGAPIKTEGYVQVPQISTSENPLIPDITYTGRGTPSNSARSSGGGKGGGGGGGGSTKTNYAKHQKSKPKEVERYKEINDELSDLSRALDRASDASDRLWGQNRLKSMEEERDLIRQQADALQRKKEEAEDYYKKDKKALNDYLKSSWTGYRENENGPETAITSSLAALGLGNLAFEYDADGSITNWEDVYSAIYKKYNDMQDYWANPANWQGPNGGDAQEQYENEILKPFEEWIQGLEKVDKQYQDTTELIKDLNEELTDNLNTWQDLNFESLTYKLELKLQINENDLKRIEYYMDKLDGDFYQMGENLANYSAQIQNTEDALEVYQGHLVDITKAYTDLDEQYQAGQISEVDYYKELQKIHDESYDYLSTLTELNKTMQEYFENTLDAAVEELEKYTDRLDHVNDSLEHYQEIMKLMGKQSDYKMISAFLQGIANNNMNRYLVSKTFYEELVGKRSVLESQLVSADLTEEGRKTIQKELLALNVQVEEAEDKMLDNAQATAESMQAIWQNTVDEISHEFEMLATDGLGFDFLNESLDRLESRQNEYLTKTNQLYEMNSLLRKLQADSDKTNNLAAKQRIANFSNEMEQLRDKNELSKLDLDIAKARYQQLLAEIALEEAQNAKSMVRLHRDNEGNYGYMYTADQDKVGAAEDALAKANNDLYNIVLEGTNKYGQMSVDLAEEYIEKRAALEQWAQENHLEESEEYQRKLYELQQEYERLRLASAREYNTAYTWLANPEVSTLGAEEAWTTEQKNAILASQNPYIYLETSKKLADSTKDFFENIQPLLEGVNSLASAIGTPEELIGNLTDYSNGLTEALIGDGGLVDAIGSELQEVLDGTNKYLHEQQKELLETQRSWEALDNEIAKAIVLQSGITGESIADETLQRIIASAKFDTGGYTGRWGNSGKLAILHEKELILNQEDTENLLLSVDILRRLTNALDLQAMSSGLASISSATSINAGGSTLQQDVTIHAEFPNAVDHNEIEMAFDTLINRASQYMGRF